MSEPNWWTFISGFILGFLIAIVAIFTCVKEPTHELKVKAVQVGAAYWQTDAEGHVEFKWKEQNK